MEILMVQTLIALLLSFTFARFALAVQPLKVQGPHFVNSVTGDRFQIIGVDYQPGGQSAYDPASKKDPLSDGEVCLRDAALLQRLGVNTIRVYNLDPTLDHNLCASIFNRVGIYMLLDVNSPLGGESLSRGNPGESYNVDYLTRIFGIVEAFKGYPNTLGFFAGNEVINDGGSSAVVPPYLRAVQRDLKNYIAKHSTRTIPVGYSAAAVQELLGSTWQYLQCAIDGDADDVTRADFFGLNTYTWCSSADNLQTSGYGQLIAQYANTTIPIIFSEYGCNKAPPRTFDEVQALYGPEMTPVMSGGLVYEFSQEESNYGLVDINADGSARLLQDYDNLQRQYGKIDTSKFGSAGAATNAQPPRCNSSLIDYPSFNTSFTVPSTPSGAQSLIDDGIPNANQGKPIDVTKTQVTQKVQDSSGKDMTGLAVRLLPADQINTPAPVSSATATGSGPSPTESKKGAALRLRFDGRILIAAILLIALA